MEQSGALSQDSTMAEGFSQGSGSSLEVSVTDASATASITTIPATPASQESVDDADTSSKEPASKEPPTARTELREGDYMMFSYSDQTVRMWVRRDRDGNFMMDQSPFVKVERIEYPDGSQGYATYLLPGSKRGDLMGQGFTFLCSPQQAALLSPYERQHQRQLQKGVPGALQLAWDLLEQDGKLKHLEVVNWIDAWNPNCESTTQVYGIGVYNPRLGDDLPLTAKNGVQLALALQENKLAATYVDAATCAKDINCAFSDKFQTVVQLVDVPIESPKVLAGISYGNDPNLRLFLGDKVQEDADGEEVMTCTLGRSQKHIHVHLGTFRQIGMATVKGLAGTLLVKRR